MPLALMFHVKDGGVSEPVKWSKDNLQPDRSIIILDEASSSLYLWHGAKQGLVQRRTALRQAQSLKGHGYTVGKSIIGRDTKQIIEIDERKIGREPETTKNNENLQAILNSKYKEMGDLVITFDLEGTLQTVSKPKAVKTQIQTLKAETMKKPEARTLPKPVVQPTSTTKKPIPSASEYQEPAPIAPATQGRASQFRDEAKAGLFIASVLSKYEDIWISRKPDGAYSVEMMDGPICVFKVSNNKLSYAKNSFNGISTNIRSDIQKKFDDLSRLL
ncbi:MAG: hypothetical protein ACFFAS_00750 [Promethearchaeota archaeon]